MARWDDLFADLEGQLDAADAAELDAEVEALQVAAWSRMALLDRLRVAADAALTIVLVDGSTVRGRAEAVGPDWLLLLDGSDELLVPASALADVSGLPPRGEAEPSMVTQRLGLGHALRRVAADREPVLVARLGAPPLRCRIMRVGLDHVDVAAAYEAVVPAGMKSLPFAALLVLRRL